MGIIEQHYMKSEELFSSNGNDDGGGYRKARDERIKLPTLKNRYQSPHYVSQMRSYKQQVVIKIVSRASGMTAINRLGDYISRDITPEDSRILGKEGHDLKIMNISPSKMKAAISTAPKKNAEHSSKNGHRILRPERVMRTKHGRKSA